MAGLPGGLPGRPGRLAWLLAGRPAGLLADRPGGLLAGRGVVTVGRGPRGGGPGGRGPDCCAAGSRAAGSRAAGGRARGRCVTGGTVARHWFGRPGRRGRRGPALSLFGLSAGRRDRPLSRPRARARVRGPGTGGPAGLAGFTGLARFAAVTGRRGGRRGRCRVDAREREHRDDGEGDELQDQRGRMAGVFVSDAEPAAACGQPEGLRPAARRGADGRQRVAVQGGIPSAGRLGQFERAAGRGRGRAVQARRA